MNVVDVGAGPAVVFLHGNPTSSHLWRHALAARPQGFRCLAVDLIGMGASGKPDIAYDLEDHIRHVDALIDALGVERYALVAHDWGVAISLDRLRRRPDEVQAVAFMEGHLRPLPDWDAFDEGGRDLFRRLRTPGEGEQMVLEDNFFIDTLLPAALQRRLSDAELDAYRAPYPTPDSRRPLLAWARQIPVAGTPGHPAETLGRAIEAAQHSRVPKLLVHGSPGAIMTAEAIAWCRTRLPELTVVDVGAPAGHFLPEDRPEQVSAAVWGWLTGLGLDAG